MTADMTEYEKSICHHLVIVGNQWTSPTNIAALVCPGTGRHSAWASPICLRMVKKGFLERDNRGWYRLTTAKAVEGREDE